MKKTLLIHSIILSSLVATTYDQTTTPQSQTDIPKLCGAIILNSPSGYSGSSNPFGACSTPSPTPTPTPTPNSGGGATYTPYVAPTVIEPTIIEPKIKLQISNLGVQESNIDQKESNNPNEQIFNNIETLSDGKRADTQIKLSDKEFNLNVSILGNKKSDETNVKAPANTEVNMDNNGNSTLKVDKDVEVRAKRDGKIEVKHKDLNIEVTSSGANVEISENKTITITKKNTTIEIKPNGEIKATITNSNGVKYNFDFPTNSNNKGATIEDGALVGEYKALSKFFIVKDKNYKRGLTYGNESVEVVPLNSEAQFEEKLYFEQNYRGLILRSGEAEIIVDGTPIEMQKDKEYIIIIQNGGNSLNSIYGDNYLHLRKGWSLISTPINSEIDVEKSFYTKDLAYGFKDGKWIENPKTLKPNEGIWVKYDFNIYIYFDEYNTNESYEFNSTILNSGWNLVGTGANTTLTESYKSVWAFDNIDKKWVENPTQILRGYGFWIKK